MENWMRAVFNWLAVGLAVLSSPFWIVPVLLYNIHVSWSWRDTEKAEGKHWFYE